MILNAPNLYIIESFSSLFFRKTRAEILTLPTQLRRRFQACYRLKFRGRKGDFCLRRRCFGYEHFCPFAVKVLTPAQVFVYN